MEKVVLSLAVTFVTAGLMAQSGSAGRSEVGFKDVKTELTYNNYLQLKDALVASNADAARESAARLKTSLGSVSNSQNAMSEADKIATTATIDVIRKTFASLSTEMTAIVKAGKVSKGVLYLEYCPMANKNTGAYWLSNEKEIKNPYFGDKMLKCGSVKETIH